MGLISRQLKSHNYRNYRKVYKIHDKVLNRNFSPNIPNQVWTGDITYTRIKGVCCYLDIVMDLYARHIVGFDISDSPNTELATSALKLAYYTRLKPKGVLFHSEQVTHYTSEAFSDFVESGNGMTHSMSLKSNCWNNFPTERRFRSFKTWTAKNEYQNINQAISNYIWNNTSVTDLIYLIII